jgi:hypothetical protein
LETLLRIGSRLELVRRGQKQVAQQLQSISCERKHTALRYCGLRSQQHLGYGGKGGKIDPKINSFEKNYYCFSHSCLFAEQSCIAKLTILEAGALYSYISSS